MTPFVLSVVFFLPLTPTAIVLRLPGEDTMRRKLVAAAGTLLIN